MIAFALAALLATAPMDPALAGAPQTPPPVAAGNDPVDLEDIEVTGRPLDSMIRSFVNEVAAPNSNRGIARWRNQICVGVANLRAEPAQYIVDRVSTVAEDIGLTPGRPGCAPNVIIIATDEPTRLAEDLVRERRRVFRLGGAGTDRGAAALRAFVASDKPVRWWQLSMPVDAETGERATRLAGECRRECADAYDFAPVIHVAAASRLTTQIVDNIFRTVVILDVDEVSRVSPQQLADYVAMVTLAQIDPEADTRRYASILNVFDSPDRADGLTDWDKAYLEGLYNAERTRRNLRSGRTEIASTIRRAHERLQAGAED